MAFKRFIRACTTSGSSKLHQNHSHLNPPLDKQLIKAIIKLGTLLYLTDSPHQEGKKIAKNHTNPSNNARLK